ncbi:MAG: hypothetical protein K2K80_05635 [Clostridia bacterium]|nr:hypothetical protein [Clostridia bacterium]
MFNFKKTAEDVLKIFKDLSEEEKPKVLSALNPLETEDEAQIDEAEEHIEERGEVDGTKDQTAKDIEDESVGEQEHLDGNEDTQSAKDRIDESEGAEAADEASDEPEVKDDGEDRYQALTARIDALEAMVNDMRKAQADAVEEEHDRDFGMSPGIPEGGQEEDDRYKRVMRGYAKNNSNQYL